jgi:glutaredoxin-like protein NrdH
VVTVYSKPSCVQCNATYRKLDEHGVDYEVKDLTQDINQLEIFKAEGLFQAPVVVAGEQRWTGFRPDLIEGLPPGAKMEEATTQGVAA